MLNKTEIKVSNNNSEKKIENGSHLQTLEAINTDFGTQRDLSNVSTVLNNKLTESTKFKNNNPIAIQLQKKPYVARGKE